MKLYNPFIFFCFSSNNADTTGNESSQQAKDTEGIGSKSTGNDLRAEKTNSTDEKASKADNVLTPADIENEVAVLPEDNYLNQTVSIEKKSVFWYW